MQCTGRPYLEGYSPLNEKAVVYRQFSYVYDEQANTFTGERLNTAGAVTEEGFCYVVSELKEVNLADASIFPATVFYQAFSGEEAKPVLDLDHAVWSVFGDNHNLLIARAGGRTPATCAFSIQDEQVTCLGFPQEMKATYFRSVTREGAEYRFSNEEGVFGLNIEENELTLYHLVNTPEGYSSSAAYWSFDADEVCVYGAEMKKLLFFTQ